MLGKNARNGRREFKGSLEEWLWEELIAGGGRTVEGAERFQTAAQLLEGKKRRSVIRKHLGNQEKQVMGKEGAGNDRWS